MPAHSKPDATRLPRGPFSGSLRRAFVIGTVLCMVFVVLVVCISISQSRQSKDSNVQGSSANVTPTEEPTPTPAASPVLTPPVDEELANLGGIPQEDAWGTPLADVNLGGPTKSVVLDVEDIEQLPELPTGCEITSAAILVNYAGYPVDKVDLDHFLPKTTDDVGDGVGVFVETDDPSVAFIGDTRDENGSSCNEQPIIVAIDGYLASVGSTAHAYDLSGSTPDALYQSVASGIPVEVWVTTYMSDYDTGYGWFNTFDDGTEAFLGSNFHAMVLMGYSSDSVVLADPLDEVVVYPKEAFEKVWTDRGSMAVVIYKS